MSAKHRAATCATAVLTALWLVAAGAHAFPEHEEPGVGAVVHQAPKQVRIEFNAKLEGAFSTVTVKDSAGKTVSGGSRVGPDAQSLGAALAPLAPGEYHVYWKVVAWDGHTTEGDYIFSVRP
jgi:methionine-rich copper-binding protein CopC